MKTFSSVALALLAATSMVAAEMSVSDCAVCTTLLFVIRHW